MATHDDATRERASTSEPAGGDVLTITNEFTSVRVRKVPTRNGERLEIHSAKLGFTIRLDPLELESLTWQTPDTFCAFLAEPYGPEDVTGARPLSELMVLEASRPASWDATEP